MVNLRELFAHSAGTITIIILVYVFEGQPRRLCDAKDGGLPERNIGLWSLGVVHRN